MDKFKGHTAEEIENRIIELSHSYTPEWHYDKENPDIGAAIARIFASQMEDNVGILDDVLERYHAEFVNFLDLTVSTMAVTGLRLCVELSFLQCLMAEKVRILSLRQQGIFL